MDARGVALPQIAAGARRLVAASDGALLEPVAGHMGKRLAY